MIYILIFLLYIINTQKGNSGIMIDTALLARNFIIRIQSKSTDPSKFKKALGDIAVSSHSHVKTLHCHFDRLFKKQCCTNGESHIKTPQYLCVTKPPSEFIFQVMGTLAASSITMKSVTILQLLNQLRDCLIRVRQFDVAEHVATLIPRCYGDVTIQVRPIDLVYLMKVRESKKDWKQIIAAGASYCSRQANQFSATLFRQLFGNSIDTLHNFQSLC